MDKIKDVAQRLGIITVEDMERYTALELIMMIANKMNEFREIINDYSDELQNLSDKIQYLLNGGTVAEVEQIFNEWLQDGTFDTLINQSALKGVNELIVETNAQLSNKASALELDVERKRIDNFTKIQQGSVSTTGDAELTDGRIGADAVVYDNIGEAIRTQIKNKIDEVKLKFSLNRGGYIHYANGEIKTFDSLYYSDFIELFNSNDVSIKNLNYNSQDSAGLGFYDLNKDFISGYQYNNETDLTIKIPSNAKYMRFTLSEHAQFNNVVVYQNEYDIIKSVYENSKNSRSEVVLSFDEGKYLRSDGSFISNNSFKTATVVDYNKAGRYEITGRVADAARLYAIYDQGGSVVKVFPEGEENIKNSLYTDVVDVQIGQKLVVCCSRDEISVVNLPVKEVTNNFVSAITSEVGIGEVTYDTLKEGRYVGKSGNFLATSGQSFTSIELSVFPNQRFKIRGTCTDNQRLYSLVNKNGVVVKVFPDEDNGIITKKYSDIVTIPNDVVKIRVCSYRDAEKNITQLPILNSLSSSIELEDFSYLNHLVSDVLCIGDSLTRGAYYSPEHNGTSIKESYPYFLGKINNWTVTNAGKSGWYSTNWYKEERNNYNFSLYDSFIIWLGTNNGYTDTLENDTNAAHYQDYADTETGSLCKIIEDIKENRPKANIFLLNLFASSGDLDISNSVIEQIGRKYNIPVFNMNDGSIFRCEEHDILHPFGNNVHFGKVGNVTVANKISNYITEYIKENKANFEQLYTE